MHFCKTRTKKRRTPAAYHLLCESGFSFLRVRVVLGIHHTAVAYSLSNVVLYHFQSQIFFRILSSHVWRFDVKPYLGQWLGVSIARWAGCLCPYATQREQSPCPSEGLNWDPRGCKASAPRPQTSGAQASTPVGSLRRCRQNHLK